MTLYWKQNQNADVAPRGSVEVILRDELARCRRWACSFECERKDHRYYEIVEDTIQQGFDYRYFIIKDANGGVCAVQPFFILDQDLLVGTSARIQAPIDCVRQVWPRFLRMRTLMVGCAAGEGHLDNADLAPCCPSRLLASATVHMRASLRCRSSYSRSFRQSTVIRCNVFCNVDFTRVPSLPMTKLNIDYRSFDDYMNRALNSATRTKLRKKFRATAQAAPIEMSVVGDITPIVNDIYPLYLQVYERSKLHFEKLTKNYSAASGM